MKRYTNILGQLGYIFYLISFVFCLPLLSLFWYRNELMYLPNFLVPAIGTFSVGLMLTIIFKQESRHKLTKSEQISVVVIVWILCCLIFTLPFVTSGVLDFTRAFFDVSSAVSTTGLSVIDVTTCPKVLLLFHTFISFFGGLGIILILVALFVNSSGFSLYRTEGHNDRFVPSFQKTVKIILSIYCSIIGAGILLLIIAGMPAFDAINVSISAVATDGFTVTSNSIESYNSHWVNIITMVLMIAGSLSFYTHLLIIRGKFKKAFTTDDVILFFRIIVIMVVILMCIFWLGGNLTFWNDLEKNLYIVISAISTTGFAIENSTQMLNFNQTFVLVISIAMIIGGNIGSTAGGIKVNRINIMLKSFKWYTKKFFSSENKLERRVIKTIDGVKNITDKEIINSLIYILIFFMILLGGTLIFTMSGYPAGASFFEVTSALTNGGLSLGITESTLDPSLLWVLSALMFLGRLEIFIVLAFFTRLFGNIKRFLKYKI